MKLHLTVKLSMTIESSRKFQEIPRMKLSIPHLNQRFPRRICQAVLEGKMHKPRKRVRPDDRQRVFQLLKARTPVGEVSVETGVSQSQVYKLKGEYESSLPDVPREAVIQALKAYAE